MTNKEKFLKLVSNKPSDALEKSEVRIANKEDRKKARRIALNILNELDNRKWDKKQLADKMNMPISDINKLVKGKKIPSQEVIDQLNAILGINY